MHRRKQANATSQKATRLCIKCGEIKKGCWTQCYACAYSPYGEVELADSLCMSDQMLDDEEDIEAVIEFIKGYNAVPVFPAAYRHALSTVRKASTSLSKRGLLPENSTEYTSGIARIEVVTPEI